MVTTATSRRMSYTVSGPRDLSGIVLWSRRPSPVPSDPIRFSSARMFTAAFKALASCMVAELSVVMYWSTHCQLPIFIDSLCISLPLANSPIPAIRKGIRREFITYPGTSFLIIIGTIPIVRPNSFKTGGYFSSVFEVTIISTVFLPKYGLQSEGQRTYSAFLYNP